MTFAIIAGLIIPFIISFLKNKEWSPEAKQALAIAVSLVAAAGVSIFDNGLDVSTWEAVVSNFGVIFASANIWYNQYFGHTEVNHKLEDRGVGHVTEDPHAEV
jgi:hypothetical protein